jgi:3',5'-cyclic AMP phosphodiesterase CpdA
MIRLAHLSDIHITAPHLDWKLRDWFNKRHAAWINFRWLGRRHRFSRADEVLSALVTELAERRPEHIIFSGDATALGFESEIRRACQMLRVDDAGMPPGLAVPGNHDYCTRPAAASGHFERYFAPWQQGTRLNGELYPFAQRVGHLTLVAVNTCTGNIWPFDAAGSIGLPQCDRLAQLLKQLPSGPRILVTHYPVCLANGRPESRVHGLRDLTSLVKVAAEGGIHLWLHGHRHHAYFFQQPPLAPFPVICAGSATQNHLWSYGEYAFDGWQCHARRRVFEPKTGRYRDESEWDLTLGS